MVDYMVDPRDCPNHVGEGELIQKELVTLLGLNSKWWRSKSFVGGALGAAVVAGLYLTKIREGDVWVLKEEFKRNTKKLPFHLIITRVYLESVGYDHNNFAGCVPKKSYHCYRKISILPPKGFKLAAVKGYIGTARDGKSIEIKDDIYVKEQNENGVSEMLTNKKNLKYIKDTFGETFAPDFVNLPGFIPPTYIFVESAKCNSLEPWKNITRWRLITIYNPSRKKEDQVIYGIKLDTKTYIATDATLYVDYFKDAFQLIKFSLSSIGVYIEYMKDAKLFVMVPQTFDALKQVEENINRLNPSIPFFYMFKNTMNNGVKALITFIKGHPGYFTFEHTS